MFASILEQRVWAAWIFGVAAAHLALVGAGLTGWVCPIREVSGLSCPGCGLSTSALQFLRGAWRESFASHAFSPVFLLGLGALGVVAVLPGGPRRNVIGAIARWEERTGGTALLAGGLLVYWALRLAPGPG